MQPKDLQNGIAFNGFRCRGFFHRITKLSRGLPITGINAIAMRNSETATLLDACSSIENVWLFSFSAVREVVQASDFIAF
jgi:hypothetical protein